MTQKITKAWIAGFMDGEGSFQIKRQKRKVKNGMKIHYQTWITCGMSKIESNLKALKIIQNIYGGNMCEIKENESNRKGAYHWTIVSKQALKFLEDILPYLVVKKQHALIIIKHQKTMVRGEKFIEMKLKQREKAFQKLRIINHKGKVRLQRLSEETSSEEATV